jgi:hypothetical protein
MLVIIIQILQNKIMEKLSKIGKLIIDNIGKQGNLKIVIDSVSEFKDRIKTYDDWEDLVILIEYDRLHLLLPVNICDLICNRFEELNIETSAVLSWRAFVINLYHGETTDRRLKAEELLAEAENLKKRGL